VGKHSGAALLVWEVVAASWADCGFFEHADFAVIVSEVF
jgi:hypothetical protein